jgi:thiosulfate dehydrogenase [quinone] large subunit
MTTLTSWSGGSKAGVSAISGDWRAASIAMLSIRAIQGFVYWGGGSRRFIYAPAKLDPAAPSWMANKLQSAMPGALLGLDRIIAFLLHHFWLLHAAIILFSAVELIAGAALMAGLLTRFAAFISIGLSVALMLMFGWQGGTSSMNGPWRLATSPWARRSCWPAAALIRSTTRF